MRTSRCCPLWQKHLPVETRSCGKHEYDISNYYEGSDEYYKDDMRKFCYFNNLIAFPDITGNCHQ